MFTQKKETVVEMSARVEFPRWSSHMAKNDRREATREAGGLWWRGSFFGAYGPCRRTGVIERGTGLYCLSASGLS